MKRREFIALVGGAAAWPLAAHAQRPARPYRVVWVASISPVSSFEAHPITRAFQQRLRELGYIEGKNLVLEMRSAEGTFERLPEIIRDVVAQGVDIIISPTNVVTRAAKVVTSTVPIVMTGGTALVELGIVQSISRPGENITGLSLEVSLEYVGKRLELTRELLPSATRLALLTSAESPPVIRGHLSDVGRALGFSLLWAEHTTTDFSGAFALVGRERPDAMFVTSSAASWVHRQKIVDFAAEGRLPAIHPTREFVEAGGLISFGVNVPDLTKRAADYVDRILKGSSPADLPIEMPRKYELVINMKIAKALGLTIPQSVLIRADEVVE